MSRKSNRDRINEAMELLGKGLQPFVERELMRAYGKKAAEIVELTAGGPGKSIVNLADPQTALVVIWEQWNAVFKNTLGYSDRSLVSELREVRKRWAHMSPFSADDTYRALDSVTRLLTSVSAPEADEAERLRKDFFRTWAEESQQAAKRAATAPVEGKPAANLRPWREVVTPHPDVASGRYQQAEFAADLWQVYLGEGADEYRDPAEFYRRTFLTEGLRQLLTRAVERLAGSGGDPVVELQTNFGGGKTHSMLALYHLFSGEPVANLPGADALMKENGLTVPEGVRRAVIVGTKVSPGIPQQKPDGTVIRTLWGEIAWQLGGREGYEMVREADQTATNPGDALWKLFDKYSPCLILIDEWVAYARQLHEDASLPGGTFDTQFSFAQNLTECAKAAKKALLVVSIPASESPSPHDGRERISDIEIGGERGRAALVRLKNAIGRVEASWRPASQEEGFEIVRRRLFEPITEPELRDEVARSFVDLYRSNAQEFPSECREMSFERRIRAAYPIHPELFDRLYSDWSTLDKFQRTRGVLRLMAAVIHYLWERQDPNLLIMPATVPIDDPRVQFELTRYLEDQWVPVIESDIDGAASLPLALDRDNPHLGRYSACRRVARTIYMGSAPTRHVAHRGLDDRHVKLGCVQPGESVATFGDALRRLTDQAKYLYVDGKRFWYDTQPTVTRMADDRARQVAESVVADEIHRRLREEARTRGDFVKVHACAPSGDVPDDREARLVILGPEYPHVAKEAASRARAEAATILRMRSNSPRIYQNTLVFLAADGNRLQDLEEAVRQYLAWRSIWDERETLDLNPTMCRQAETKLRSAEETVETRIPETYQWLLVPSQADPRGQPEWTETKVQGSDALAVRASKRLRHDDLLALRLGGTRLRLELDRIPLWRGNHVGVRQLIEDFATYLYLPRLRDEEVLLQAIADGASQITWQSETFAYAEGWDEEKELYVGLKTGQIPRVIADGRSLVVKSEVAAEQRAREQAAAEGAGATGMRETGAPPREPTPGVDGEPTPEPPGPAIRRFHGSVALDPLRMGRDAGRIAEEVVQHLQGLVGARVRVTLEIQADVPDGVPDNTMRTVTENCRTLKFDEGSGFEEE